MISKSHLAGQASLGIQFDPTSDSLPFALHSYSKKMPCVNGSEEVRITLEGRDEILEIDKDGGRSSF